MARILGVSRSTVRYWKKKCGIPTYRKPRSPKHINLLQPKELAFIIGLWYGDGHIEFNRKTRNYFFTLDLSDNELVEYLKRVILFREYARGSGLHRLFIYSKIFVQHLIDLGCVPGNKAETDPPIPEWILEDTELTLIFALGYFLTDGCIYPRKPFIDFSANRTIKNPSISSKLIKLILKGTRHLGAYIIHASCSKVFKELSNLGAPKGLKQLSEVLADLGIRGKLKLYRLLYYHKTRRVVSGWKLTIYTANARKLAKSFLTFAEKLKLPQQIKKLEKLRQIIIYSG